MQSTFEREIRASITESILVTEITLEFISRTIGMLDLPKEEDKKTAIKTAGSLRESARYAQGCYLRFEDALDVYRHCIDHVFEKFNVFSKGEQNGQN